MKEVSGRFGNTITCDEKEDEKLKDLMDIASKEISSNSKYEEVELLEDEELSLPATDDVKNFSYTIIDEEVYLRENSVLIKQNISDKNKEKIKDYLDVMNALKDVIEKQKDDFSDEEIKESQAKLNEVYDNFSKKHGFINSLSNTRALKEDSNFPLVSSIEILDDEDNFKAKSDIFSKRTITKAKVVDHVDTSLEALVLSVSQKGYVDFEYMESITNKDRDTLIGELEGEIFLDIKDEQYGCKYMRTDSGGGLTNKLLENGLIDEISLVISPCFVGNKEKQLFDNLLLSEKVNLELQGTENAEHGCLSLRYAVKNKD